MKKLSLVIAAIATLFVSFKSIKDIVWKLDTTHSSLGFSFTHLGIADLRGSINMNKGSITVTGEDFTGGNVFLEVDMKTIDTDNEKRDDHLRTADFFDVEKFPVATFQSTEMIKSGTDMYTINGNLTMHGITKPVTFKAVVKNALSPMNNKPIAGMKITGTFNRIDFNVSADTPDAIISNEISVEANLEFTKTDTEAGK